MVARLSRNWRTLGAVAIMSAAVAWTAPAEEKAAPPAGKAAEKPGDKTASGAEPARAEYVGVETCRGCHPDEYRVWAGSKHSRSFVSLQTESARKISCEPTATPGIPTEKMMRECSPCHARGMEIPRRDRSKTFHPEDGVHCEACHGPGGHYAKEEIMKDPCRRTEAGLKKLRKEECLQCHKERPSHAILERPAFDHEKMWPKIAHRNSAKPAKEQKP